MVTTGNKAEQKVYYHHTMYPGGLKEVPFRRLMEKKPEEARTLSLMTVLRSYRSPRPDSPQSRLWYATQEQAARKKATAVIHI